MAKSCRVTPMVNNPRGEEVPSKLYTGLNSVLTLAGKGGRNNVLPLYQQTLDPKFTEDMKDRGAHFDENGEVSLYDFLNNTKEGKSIDRGLVLKYLNSPNNFFNKNDQSGLEYTSDNRNQLIDKIVEFNDSEWSQQYTARLVVRDNKFSVEVNPTTNNSTKANKRVKYFSNLTKRLSSILEEWGIAVSDLENLESRVTNGYIDFGSSAKTADGLISLIKIAKGRKGDKALPEEFAHFVLRALRNSPLITRLMADLERDDKYKKVLGSDLSKYQKEYNNNVSKLVEEAAGKVLAQKLRASSLNTENPTNLTDRVILAFQKMFSKFDEMKLRRAAIDSDNTLGILAEDLLHGKYPNIDTTNLGKDKLYSLLDSVKRNKTLWDNLYEVTIRRQHVYKLRKKDLDLTGNDTDVIDREFLVEEQEKLIDIQDKAAHEEDWSEYSISKEDWQVNTLVNTMALAVEDCARLKSMLDELTSDSGHLGTMNATCAKLRMIRDYIESYKKLYSYYTDLFAKGFDEPELNNYPEIQTILGNLKAQNASLNQELDIMSERYRQAAEPIFIKALAQVCPEGAILRLNGEVTDLNTLVRTADDDLGFMNRWLNSMANTPDEIAKLYDQLVKQKKGIARQESLAIRRKIIAAGKKLSYKGPARIQEFMYMHNPDGTIATDKYGMPRYIEEADTKACQQAYMKFRNELNEKYKDVVDADEQMQKEIDDWCNTYMVKRRGEWFANPTYFPNAQYTKLTSEEKEFYHTFMECKEQLDKYLPKSASDLYKPIMIRKEGLEKILTANNGHELWKTIKDYFGEMFKRKETDDEFGETKIATQDFSGRELKMLPIYYKFKASDTDIANYSMDCVSNMILYAQMATNYKALNQVVNTLEVGRDLLTYRSGIKKENGKALVEHIKDGAYKLDNFLSRSDGDSHFKHRIDDFMDMQVYGQTKRDKTILSGLSSSKMGDLWATIIALNTTAINFTSGIVNVLQGLHQINIEMFAHEYYNTGDILKAKWYFWKNCWGSIVQLGNPAKTHKLALFDEDFNIMQDYESSNREVDFYKKNKFYRLMNMSTLFFMNNAGEYYLQNLTAIALANHDYIVDGNGNHISVFDAYETKYIDPNNHKLGAYLTLKHYNGPSGKSQTYKTQDGRTIITMEQLKARQLDMKNRGQDVDLYSKRLLWNSNEISEYEFKNEFSRKSAKINQDLHGIYNQEDKNAMQQYALGRLAIMYRKHIVPNAMKRWKKEGYDFDLKADTSGFQRDAAQFWKRYLKELFVGDDNGKHHGLIYAYNHIGEDRFNISDDQWNSMSDTEKTDFLSRKLATKKRMQANMRRNLANFVDFWTTQSLILLLDNDDDDDSWWKQMLLTVLYRQRAEIAFFTPSSLFTPYNALTDWLRVFKEPIIGMSWAETYLGLVRLLNPWAWFTEVESGRYKGYTQAEKILLQSVPFLKQIRNTAEPDASLFK